MARKEWPNNKPSAGLMFSPKCITTPDSVIVRGGWGFVIHSWAMCPRPRRLISLSNPCLSPPRGARGGLWGWGLVASKSCRAGYAWSHGIWKTLPPGTRCVGVIPREGVGRQKNLGVCVSDHCWISMSCLTPRGRMWLWGHFHPHTSPTLNQDNNQSHRDYHRHHTDHSHGQRRPFLIDQIWKNCEVNSATSEKSCWQIIISHDIYWPILKSKKKNII